MNFVTMNSRSKLVCSNGEKKRRRQNRATNEQQRYRCDVKFSYLERVHALPVLVQVVHEIHDDVKKKEFHSRAECAKIFEEKSELKRVKILFTVEMCFELHACI